MVNLLIATIVGLLVFVVIDSTKNIKINTDSLLDRRLENLKNKTLPEKDFDMQSVLMYSNDFRFKNLAKFFKNTKIIDFIKNFLFLADVKLRVDTFLILSFICGAIGIFIFLLTSPILFPVGFMGFFIPLAVLKFKIDNRLKLFSQQFPDALNLMANSLRAGHSLLGSFELIVNEMPSPVCQVFKNAVDDISLGTDTKEAIHGMQKVIPQSVDLKFFVTAVLIQRDVGGNLTEVLDTLSNTIRERFKLLGQLKAETSQTRFSGIILSIAPPAIAGILFLVSPDYMKPLLETTDGHLALLGALVLLILGVYTIKKVTVLKF